MSLLSGATVTIETKWFPPLTVSLDSGGGQQGATFGGSVGGVAASLLKPKVTVAVDGTNLYSVAPAGDPGVNEWGTVRWVLVAVVAVVFVKVVL